MPPETLLRPDRPGAHRRRPTRSGGRGAGGARIPVRGAARRGQDHRGAHPGDGAELRAAARPTAPPIVARALNGERRAAAGIAGEPCGACASCTRIWTGAANLDVVELDAAANRGVGAARDLRERAMYAASPEARHKVYIVDEAHMLTREAWNALLKILEEP